MTDTALPAAAPSADATLALLWERVRQQGDMPGFARAISAILGAMRGEDEHEFDMAQTVLTDPVLTQKVLRLANSGMYSAFGQRVNTVTKAILVLGTDAIGHLALGLKLIEELSAASPDSAVAHVEMEKAVLAGMVAQQVAISAATRDPEEAVVCSMLHTLGPHDGHLLHARTLDAAAGARRRRRRRRRGAPRCSACRWKRSAAPPPSTGACRATCSTACAASSRASAASSFSHADWLAALSTMSAACAESLWHDDADGAAQVRELAERFRADAGRGAGQHPGRRSKKPRVAAAADLTIAPLSKPAERRARALASDPQARRRQQDPDQRRGRHARLRRQRQPGPDDVDGARNGVPGPDLFARGGVPAQPARRQLLGQDGLRRRRARAAAVDGVRRRLRAERVPRRAQQRPRDLHRKRARSEVRRQAAAVVEGVAVGGAQLRHPAAVHQRPAGRLHLRRLGRQLPADRAEPGRIHPAQRRARAGGAQRRAAQAGRAGRRQPAGPPDQRGRRSCQRNDSQRRAAPPASAQRRPPRSTPRAAPAGPSTAP